MSDIEGKVAREAMSECGQRTSFNISEMSPYLFCGDLKSARKIGWSANARIANRQIS
jgi:hypothetical protein